MSGFYGYLKGVSNELALRHVADIEPRRDTLAGPLGRRGDQARLDRASQHKYSVAGNANVLRHLAHAFIDRQNPKYVITNTRAAGVRRSAMFCCRNV